MITDENTIKSIQQLLTNYKKEWMPEHFDDFINDLKECVGNFNFLNILIETLELSFDDYETTFEELLDACNAVAGKKLFI